MSDIQPGERRVTTETTEGPERYVDPREEKRAETEQVVETTETVEEAPPAEVTETTTETTVERNPI